MTIYHDRYLRALQCQPVDKTPIWMMRQAGRYLPEYRALRAQAGSFMNLCQSPDLACEVTLQPLNRFDLDAAIIFSDILTIPDAMGLGLHFETNEGPKFERPIQSLQEIENLPIPDPEDQLGYVMDAIRKTRNILNNEKPLIGFSGSPWTLATYMVEGGSSKTFSKIKKMRYTDPKALHLLLDKLADSVILYLNAQIASGAQSLMIFDTWGGVLSHCDYIEFSLSYMTKITESLNKGTKTAEYNPNYVPVTFFTKGGGIWLPEIMKAGCDAVGVDWTVNLADLPKGQLAIQGNLDPFALYGNKELLNQEVQRILTEFGAHSGHVFNLGHGIFQQAPLENVEYLVETVHRLSARNATW